MKNETIEKQVWESTLHRSMVLQAENEQLESKLQLKETAYDFDTARLEEENTKLKELLKEANNWLKAFYAYEQSDFVREKVKQCLTKINQVLGEE